MTTLLAQRPKGLGSVPLEARLTDDGHHATMLEDDAWCMFLTRGTTVPGTPIDGDRFLPDPGWLRQRQHARMRLDVVGAEDGKATNVTVRTQSGTTLPLPVTKGFAATISEMARAIWHARMLTVCACLADGRALRLTVRAGRLLTAQVGDDVTEVWFDSEALRDVADEAIHHLAYATDDPSTRNAFRKAKSDLHAAAARTTRLPETGLRTRHLRALSILEEADAVFHMLLGPVLEHEALMAQSDTESLVNEVGHALGTYTTLRDANHGVTVRDRDGRVAVRLTNDRRPHLTAHPRYGAADNDEVADAIVRWCETTAERYGYL